MTRLDEPDPVAAWRTHIDKLVERAELLNERAFDRLRFGARVPISRSG